MEKKFLWEQKGFGGLFYPDGSTRPLKENVSPDMMNFRVTEGGVLEKREGYTPIFSAPSPLRGIFCGKVEGQTVYLAAAGDELYWSQDGFDRLAPAEGVLKGSGEVFFFPFHGTLYCLTGNGIQVFSNGQVSDLEPYIPTVMTATLPDGTGTLLEEKNILCHSVKQLFSPDGESVRFRPAYTKIKAVTYLTLNGQALPQNQWYWDEVAEYFVFANVPAAGINTLEVQYELSPEGDSLGAERIHGCRRAMAFGGGGDTRAFLYGNDLTPSHRYHSGIVKGKPTLSYFPETAYTLIGSGEKITSIVRHYDRQLIFTESAAYYSYLEYLEGTEGRLVASFPVLPLFEGQGHVGASASVMMEHTPCTLSGDGLFRWQNTNVRDERNAVCFSMPIAVALKEGRAETMRLFYRSATGELYVWSPNRFFVYNTRSDAFYPYELPAILGFSQGEDALYFFTAEKIFQVGGYRDGNYPITARWQSTLWETGGVRTKKRLNRFFITYYSPEEGDVQVVLRRENEEDGDSKHYSYPAAQLGVIAGRFPLRRYTALEMSLYETGDHPFQITGIGLRGVVTDKSS